MTDDSDVCVGGGTRHKWNQAAGVGMQDDVGGVGRRKKSATMAAAGGFRAKTHACMGWKRSQEPGWKKKRLQLADQEVITTEYYAILPRGR